jgi:hypothetical protein
MGPDAYWSQVGKTVEERRRLSAAESAAVKIGWKGQTRAMGALSTRRYRARIRGDGRVLCLICRRYKAPSSFWLIKGGTFINRCKACSRRRRQA